MRSKNYQVITEKNTQIWCLERSDYLQIKHKFDQYLNINFLAFMVKRHINPRASKTKSAKTSTIHPTSMNYVCRIIRSTSPVTSKAGLVQKQNLPFVFVALNLQLLGWKIAKNRQNAKVNDSQSRNLTIPTSGKLNPT